MAPLFFIINYLGIECLGILGTWLPTKEAKIERAHTANKSSLHPRKVKVPSNISIT